MTTVPKMWRYQGTPGEDKGVLPDEAVAALLKVTTAKTYKSYWAAVTKARAEALRRSKAAELLATALGLELQEEEEEAPEVAVKLSPGAAAVIYATDAYEATGARRGFKQPITREALREGIIRPRVEKSKEEQKRRSKEKAEVFTPLWVVNLQNNMVDEAWFGREGLFNRPAASDQRQWEPTVSPLVFTGTGREWWQYVADRRMEFAAGEAPYLFSPYDPTTGEYLPVKDAGGRFQRVGFLDRKLRVVSEQVALFEGSPEELFEAWVEAAQWAVTSTYGYEWQGDNLLLARLNFLNTVFDYMTAFRATLGLAKLSREANEALAVALAKLIALQVIQLDGLKQVLPESCSEDCISCSKGLRWGHDGVHPLLRWGGTLEAPKYKLLEELQDDKGK